MKKYKITYQEIQGNGYSCGCCKHETETLHTIESTLEELYGDLLDKYKNIDKSHIDNGLSFYFDQYDGELMEIVEIEGEVYFKNVEITEDWILRIQVILNNLDETLRKIVKP